MPDEPDSNPDKALTVNPAAPAGAPAGDEQPPTLYLGQPFALAGVAGSKNAQLLPANDAVGVPGCHASLLCHCGEAFRADLLTEAPASVCPHCEAKYTHVLVIASVDDPEVWGYANVEVFRNNGLATEPDDDDDDGDQDDGDPADDTPV